jgi:hypothetical protein
MIQANIDNPEGKIEKEKAELKKQFIKFVVSFIGISALSRVFVLIGIEWFDRNGLTLLYIIFGAFLLWGFIVMGIWTFIIFKNTLKFLIKKPKTSDSIHKEEK